MKNVMKTNTSKTRGKNDITKQQSANASLNIRHTQSHLSFEESHTLDGDEPKLCSPSNVTSHGSGSSWGPASGGFKGAFKQEQELAVARRQFQGTAAGDAEKFYDSCKTPSLYECCARSVNLYNESKANRCSVGAWLYQCHTAKGAEQCYLKTFESYFIPLIEDYPLKIQAALFEIKIYWTVRSENHWRSSSCLLRCNKSDVLGIAYFSGCSSEGKKNSMIVWHTDRLKTGCSVVIVDKCQWNMSLVKGEQIAVYLLKETCLVAKTRVILASV